MDNRYNEYSNMDRWTNKGWENMRQMLDQEMPQARKRRRAVWWWWAAGLLLLPILAAVGYKAFSVQTPNPTPVPAQVPAQPNPALVQKDGAAPASLQGDKSAPALSEQPTFSSTPKGMTPPSSAPQQALVPRMPGTGSKGLVPTVEVVQVVNTAHDSLSEKNAAEQVINTTAEALATHTLPETTLGSLAALLPLPNQPLPTITFPDRPFATPATPLSSATDIQPVKTTVKPFQLGLAAQTMTANFKDFNGFSTGLTVDWTAKRRWGARAGLFYGERYGNNKDQYPVATVSALDYYNNAILAANKSVLDNNGNTLAGPNAVVDPSKAALGQESVYVNVTALRRLESQVSVFYRLLPSVRVYGGGSLSYLLKAVTDGSPVVVSPTLDRAAMGNATLYSTADTKALNHLATQALPRWQAQAHLSVGWRVIPRLEVNFGWQSTLLRSGKSAAAEFAPQTGAESLGNLRGTVPSVFSLGGVWYLSGK